MVIVGGALSVAYGAVSCANSFEETALGLVLFGALAALAAKSSRTTSVTATEPRSANTDDCPGMSNDELERLVEQHREKAQRGPSCTRALWVRWVNELDRRRKMKK